MTTNLDAFLGCESFEVPNEPELTQSELDSMKREIDLKSELMTAKLALMTERITTFTKLGAYYKAHKSFDRLGEVIDLTSYTSGMEDGGANFFSAILENLNVRDIIDAIVETVNKILAWLISTCRNISKTISTSMLKWKLDKITFPITVEVYTPKEPKNTFLELEQALDVCTQESDIELDQRSTNNFRLLGDTEATGFLLESRTFKSRNELKTLIDSYKDLMVLLPDRIKLIQTRLQEIKKAGSRVTDGPKSALDRHLNKLWNTILTMQQIEQKELDLVNQSIAKIGIEVSKNNEPTTSGAQASVS